MDELGTELALGIIQYVFSDSDPVWVKDNEGEWFQLHTGLSEFFSKSGLHQIQRQRGYIDDSSHCETCKCYVEINIPDLADEVPLKYYSLGAEKTELVEGTLLSMVLDRMGLDLIR